MLFVLDSSISKVDVECVLHNRALETLLGAFQNRNHLLFCEMLDLERIRAIFSPHLSKSSRVVLNTLYNKSVEYGALVPLIEYKAVVYCEDETRSGIVKDGNIWYVPLRFFAESGLVQTALLCENEIDSELYLIFAEMYMRKQKIRGFVMSARLRGGGGSGIPKALASYVRSEVSPCLCITDGDKYYPGYAKSASSRHCDNVARISKVVKHAALEERELENLLPVDLLRKISGCYEIEKSLGDALTKNPKLWSYLDLKRGVWLEWINSQDQPTQDYWKDARILLERQVKKCIQCRGNKNDEKECGCGKIKGLGEGILAGAVKLFNQNDAKLNLRLMSDDKRWEKISKMVFDFSLAFGGEMVAVT